MITSKLNALMSRLSLASLIVISSLSLSSCQDEDFGFTKDEIRDSVYDRNFIAKYGEIDPLQSWDLSSYVPSHSFTVGTRAGSTHLFESGAENISMSVQDEWFDVPADMLNDINNVYLKEGANNLGNGQLKATKGFSFDVDDEEFYFIPIYQGQSGLDCDLHMVVETSSGTYDKMIWEKSQNIEKIPNGSVSWENIPNRMDYFKLTNNEGNTLNSSIHAKPIKFNFKNQQAKISFYLHVVQGHLNFSTTNGGEHDRLTPNACDGGEANLAFTGMKMSGEKICVLDPDQFHLTSDITNRFDCSKAFIIGCEDALSSNDNGKTIERWLSDGTTETFEPSGSNYNYNISNSDQKYKVWNDNSKKWEYPTSATVNGWGGDDDLNDLVFLVLARKLTVKGKKEITKKRYLFEDMGSVVDWDFNDVVVDLYQEKEDGVVTSQYAYLKHRCGTTPFQINIVQADKPSQTLNFSGLSTVSTQTQGTFIEGRVQDNPDIRFDLDISGNKAIWDPTHNNITITVIPLQHYDGRLEDKTSGGAHTDYVARDYETQTVTFPKNGVVPRIIAVDTDFNWTPESTDIEQSSWASYKITIRTATNGTVDGLQYVNDPDNAPNVGLYLKNRKVRLVAVADDGNVFDRWEGVSSTLASEASIEFVPTNDMTITPVFRQKTQSDSKNGTYSLSWSVKTWDSSSNSWKDNTNGGTITAADNKTQGVHTKGEVVALTANPATNYALYYWKDQAGNTDKKATIQVGGSDRTLTAYFRQLDKLILKLSDTDKGTEASKVTFTVNGVSKQPNSDGVAEFDVFRGEDVLVTASSSRGDDEWSSFFDYYYSENDTKSDIHNRKEVNLGAMDNSTKTYTVNVRYQVKSTPGYMLNNEFKADNTYGTTKIMVGDTNMGSEAWLHYGTTYKVVATPASGYEFVEWQWGSSTSTLENEKNEGNSGCKYYNAIFKVKPVTHTLTLNLTNELDRNEDISIWVNGTQATQSSDKSKFTVYVEENAMIKIKAKHNNFSDSDDVRFVVSGGAWLANGDANEVQIADNNYTMTSDKSFNLEILYRVKINVKVDGQSVSDISNVCDIKVGTWQTGTNVYLPESNSTTDFVITPKDGYSFVQWSNGGWKETSTTAKTHNSWTNNGTRYEVKTQNLTAELEENDTRVFYNETGRSLDTESNTYDLQYLFDSKSTFGRMSSTKNKIVVLFDHTCSGKIYLRTGWSSNDDILDNCGTNGLSIAQQPYIEIALTDAEIATIKESGSLTVVHTGCDKGEILKIMQVNIKR